MSISKRNRKAFLPQEGILNCPSFANVLLLFKQSSNPGQKTTDSLPHLQHMKKGGNPMKKYISMLLAAVLYASGGQRLFRN
jgi:hypothetical protein